MTPCRQKVGPPGHLTTNQNAGGRRETNCSPVITFHLNFAEVENSVLWTTKICIVQGM